MLIVALTVVLCFVAGHTWAQRPQNASICDYYAQVNFGVNNSDTQLHLIQNIVSLAFAGGSGLPNVSSDLTGTLHPGTFQNQPVDLQPWFNGSIASTNLNNQPVGINWLDAGAADPLYKYLSGQTQTVVIANTTNQYRLFGHFFIVFSHVFGCTNPPSPLAGDTSTPSLSLAYVHKYMNLTYVDLGHFIDMLTLATVHYGFSDQDSRTFNTNLNQRYNVRCAPAVTLNPAQGPQLFSLCQNPTCPLAEPNADCAAYVNLTANGIPAGNSGSSSASSSPSTTATLPPSSTSSSAPSTTTSAAQTSTTTAAAAPVSSPLSTGGIAGVAVGGAAVAGLFILALVLLFRRRRRTPHSTPNPSQPSVGYYTAEPTVYGGSPHPSHQGPPKEQHVSYVSNVPTISEMDSPRFAASPEGEAAGAAGRWSRSRSPPQQMTMLRSLGGPPAELEGYERGDAASGYGGQMGGGEDHYERGLQPSPLHLSTPSTALGASPQQAYAPHMSQPPAGLPHPGWEGRADSGGYGR